MRTLRATGRTERAETVLITMARWIENKDPNTRGHCERLSDYATRLARRLGLDANDVSALRLGGILHDIGKITVPDAILLKPAALDETEWSVMRHHPLEGELICSAFPAFQHILPIIRHHHEKMDGTGYPDGLLGERIPITARVLQVADVYDALTSARPYKAALSPERAFAIMESEVDRGWWDSTIVSEFRRLVLPWRARAATCAGAVPLRFHGAGCA